MVRSDPYTPDRGYYECQSCLYRTTANRHPGRCRECDGVFRNIAVSRE